uniref:Uncharacterized protein n=1 Tax=Malurus cyaneus samueli TaxID=2593467 RepID=A0A8C5TSW3_9PASS
RDPRAAPHRARGHTRGAQPRAPLPRSHQAVLAGADSPEEPKLVHKVQELAHKATAMAKDAFSRVRESDAARQARCPRPPPARTPVPVPGEPELTPELIPELTP